MPAGKAVLVPLLTGECDYGIPEVKNDEDLRRCAMAGNEYGTIEALVEGVKSKNLDQYTTQILDSSIFPYHRTIFIKLLQGISEQCRMVFLYSWSL